MADNTPLVAPASGGMYPVGTAPATDDVGGVLYQRIKLDVGADGASTPVTSTGLPVNDAGGSLTVDGTVAVTGTFFQATQPVSGPLTDAQLRASAVPISGTVTATGGLTDTQLRATAVPVSLATAPALVAGTANIGDVDVLTVPAPLSTTGTGTEATALRVTVATDSTGVLSVDDNGGSLTVDGTFWQATQAVSLASVPSHAVTGPLTDTELRATAVPVTANAGTNLNTSALATSAKQDTLLTELQLKADLTETQPVSLASVPSHAVTNAGTFATQNTQVRPATGTLANVASSATNVTLQASNAARLGWSVYNDSTAILYLKFAATASATSYTVQVPPSGYFEIAQPTYTGIIDGIWAAANGNARVTELTA